MSDAEPYRIVCQLLNEEAVRPYEQLATRVGQPPQSHDHYIDGLPAEVEVAVEWKKEVGGDLVLVARLYGTGTWYTERYEERVTVCRPEH